MAWGAIKHAIADALVFALVPALCGAATALLVGITIELWPWSIAILVGVASYIWMVREAAL